MFLQVVTFTADIGNDFEAIRQTNLANLTESGVRLFRGGGVYASADTASSWLMVGISNFLQRPGTAILVHDGYFVIQSRDND